MAGAIARALTIPVIGIGAGPDRDEVLVWHDLLGVSPIPCRASSRLRGLASEIRRAQQYANEVREGFTPNCGTLTPMPEEERAVRGAWQRAPAAPGRADSRSSCSPRQFFRRNQRDGRARPAPDRSRP